MFEGLNPLPAGVFVPLFGWELNPMFGAAAMSLSSFCVVTNALRLNLFRLHDASRDRAKKHRAPAAPAATEPAPLTLSVEGMMCPHCEATVKKALEALPFVAEATASHETATVSVRLSAPADEAALRAAGLYLPRHAVKPYATDPRCSAQRGS